MVANTTHQFSLEHVRTLVTLTEESGKEKSQAAEEKEDQYTGVETARWLRR